MTHPGEPIHIHIFSGMVPKKCNIKFKCTKIIELLKCFLAGNNFDIVVHSFLSELISFFGEIMEIKKPNVRY